MQELGGRLVSHGDVLCLARAGAIGCLAGFADGEEVGKEAVPSGGGQAGEYGVLEGDGNF